MKVIILAGGYGTRLGNITEAIPKPMVKIGNKPIIWHIMKIYSHFGYNDFILSLGYKAEIFKEYFYNYSIYNNDFTIDFADNSVTKHNGHDESNWKITLVDTGLNSLKGARLKRIEGYLNDDINLLSYGDFVASVIRVKAELDEKRRNRNIPVSKLLTRVAQHCAVAEDDILSNSRRREIGRARAIISYLAIRELMYPATDVAKVLNISAPSVSRCIERGKALLGKDASASKLIN